MKKVLFVFIFLSVMTSGCSCNKDTNEEVLTLPSKDFANDSSTITTPIYAANLDKYLFRDDVQYVDLRELSLILKDGYIAGFEFIPFHSLIASHVDDKTLYKMKDVLDEHDNWIYAGQVGGFYKQYEEADQIIQNLFSKDKYIFFVSHAGSEGSYMINLLLQLGYDGNKLYNICGVIGTEGAYSYKSKGNKRYFIDGNMLMDTHFEYDFWIDLTPVEE